MPQLSDTNLTKAPAPDAEELGLSVTRIFKLPLAALRASMESLARDLDRADPRREVLHGALAEIQRLGRDVQALADYAAPRPLAPLRCSIEELLQGAVARVDRRSAERLSIARPARSVTLWVDGPLLSAALANLVQVALESSREEVLLQARVEDGEAIFAVVEASACTDLNALESLRAERGSSLGLGFNLAQRDVERMGGRLTAFATPLGHTGLVVRIPRASEGRDAA